MRLIACNKRPRPILQTNNRVSNDYPVRPPGSVLVSTFIARMVRSRGTPLTWRRRKCRKAASPLPFIYPAHHRRNKERIWGMPQIGTCPNHAAPDRISYCLNNGRQARGLFFNCERRVRRRPNCSFAIVCKQRMGRATFAFFASSSYRKILFLCPFAA